MQLDPKVFAVIREANPGCALKQVFIDPEALTQEEAEDCPFVVVRRLRAPDWDMIDKIKEKNDKLAKGEKPVSLDRVACRMACVYCHPGVTVDDLLDEFVYFQNQLAQALYIFSGGGSPLVLLLPKNVNSTE